jgi:Spy/CpxP family protein refolding chaperone
MKTLALSLILATSVAFAQPRWMQGDPPGPPIAQEKLMEKLDLTADQQKQVDKLHSELQKKQIALSSKIASLRLDVRDLFREDKPDRSKIELKLSEISKAQSETKLDHLGFWFDVNKTLTPEQQKIWKECGTQRAGEFGFRNHRGAGRGPRGMGSRDCPRWPMN